MPQMADPSLGHGVGVAVRHLPVAVLAAVHLRGSLGVGTRLAVDGGGGVLEAGRVGHIAGHVVRL